MKSNPHLSSTEYTLPQDTAELGAEVLSTHDNLLQGRRTEMYTKSLSEHRRAIKEFQRVLSGRDVTCYLEATYGVDIPSAAYARDYVGLEEYFKGTQLNDVSVEIRPIARADTLAHRQAEVRALLAATPFRQRLHEVASELDGLISLSPEPGVYELTTHLDEVDDAAVLAMIKPGQYPLRIGERDGVSVIEAVISDEAPDEDRLWLHTDSAKAFLGVLDRAGMSLTDEARRELAVESDHRYGNAYAWMTRELVKEIAGYPSGLIESSENSRLPEYTNDAGADLLIDMLRQLQLRGDAPYLSDIPVTQEYVNLRDKGCKDVETYFAQSAEIPGTLTTVAIGDKLFWHKTHGGHTYINLESVTYNGIELPPGYVFKQADDGSYALLRATGFAFDKSTADSLFGVPMTDNYDAPGEEALMQMAFDSFAARRNATDI